MHILLQHISPVKHKIVQSYFVFDLVQTGLTFFKILAIVHREKLWLIFQKNYENGYVYKK
jgi:hypothetical protein